MKLILARSKTFSNDRQTTGVLFNEQLDELCKILELPWLDNVRRKSCIPEGEYRVMAHQSPRLGASFWVRDVPGRSEILIHPANHTRQLLGCLLMTFAVTGYYFQWPMTESVWQASAQFGAGFLLLWTDRAKLVEWVQGVISKKL